MSEKKPRHDGEWVSVPKEPTVGMILAFDKAFSQEYQKGRRAVLERSDNVAMSIRAAYQAMLATSPATAALGTQEGVPAEIQRRHEQDEEYREKGMTGHFVCNIFQMHRDRATLLQHTTSQARTIEALRAVAQAVVDMDDIEAGIEEAIDRLIPIARRALKEHPNG